LALRTQIASRAIRHSNLVATVDEPLHKRVANEPGVAKDDDAFV
jgi:hypothetical protein